MRCIALFSCHYFAIRWRRISYAYIPLFSVEHDKKCDNGKHKDYSKELEEGSDTDDSNSDAYESDDTFAPVIRRNY